MLHAQFYLKNPGATLKCVVPWVMYMDIINKFYDCHFSFKMSL